MGRKKIVIASVILIILFFVVVAIFSSNKKTQALPSPVSKVSSQVAVEATEKEIKALSIDGSKAIIMKESKSGEHTNYSFINSDGKAVYVTSTLPGLTLLLSGNAWDPGDSYFFIEKKEGSMRTDLVLKTSGEVFPDSAQYIDVGALFHEKFTDFSYLEATGWAAPDLLIVKTIRSDSTSGSSFWFEVSSGTFIQLYN